ncbi:hypothetical protein ACC697_29225 [Rhizobium ruizarguesonis]
MTIQITLPNSAKINFVQNEVKNSGDCIAELLANRSFDADLASAREASRDSLYATWNDKLSNSLATAYPLYLHLLINPQLAEQVLADRYFNPEGGARKRRPSKAKPALIALQYVTRPCGLDNLKSCSAYSAILEMAKDRQVLSGEFAPAMAGSTLKEALDHKRGNKKRIIKRRTFRLRLSGGMGPVSYHDFPVPAAPDDAFYDRVVSAIRKLLGNAAEAPDNR